MRTTEQEIEYRFHGMTREQISIYAIQQDALYKIERAESEWLDSLASDLRYGDGEISEETKELREYFMCHSEHIKEYTLTIYGILI